MLVLKLIFIIFDAYKSNNYRFGGGKMSDEDMYFFLEWMEKWKKQIKKTEKKDNENEKPSQ